MFRARLLLTTIVVVVRFELLPIICNDIWLIRGRSSVRHCPVAQYIIAVSMAHVPRFSVLINDTVYVPYSQREYKVESRDTLLISPSVFKCAPCIVSTPRTLISSMTISHIYHRRLNAREWYWTRPQTVSISLSDINRGPSSRVVDLHSRHAASTVSDPFFSRSSSGAERVYHID